MVHRRGLNGIQHLQTEQASRIYLDIYPDARFEVIPGATHFSFDENPSEFARVIQEFLMGR